jgi:demethylmenaquinone methyltransferase/2-methoxy-6-polyprenyl-1,4-benzoquinol methylase
VKISKENDLAFLEGADRARYVREMFSQIAPRYDLMNRLMTVGQDAVWRREVIQRARLAPGSWLLDLGAGTGDLAAEAVQRCPGCQVIAADFTIAMMQVGQQRYPLPRLNWSAADAGRLPYLQDTYDAVVSGFLLRNVPDLRRALAEQYRVLKPGGRIVVLDTSPPANDFLAPAIRFHLHTIIPALGKLVTGQAEAYQYLPSSTEGFLPAERLAARLIEAGFQHVGFVRRMFGTIAIHWGYK